MSVLLKILKKEFEQFKENHIIVEISSKNNFTEQNILVLLKYVISHQQNGLSFVVISKNVDVDHFPDTFNIVPTLIEAEDVIELENIQRSLGF